MPLLLKGQLADDIWFWADHEEPLDAESGYAALCLPVERLAESRGLAVQALGVKINGESSVADIDLWIPQLQMIAIEFPQFRDGRGYSLARQIRQRGFQGELRALGQLGYDQLAFLHRCGFNAFHIEEERYQPEILNALKEITVNYQGHIASIESLQKKRG